METRPIIRKRRRWLRVILWMVGVILLLPIFIVLLFQLSPVQTFTKKKVESYLRNKFHTTVLIGSLRLKWWNSLSIEKVYLEDKAKQPLLYSGSLNVSFNLLALTHNELVIKKLHWDDILINIYRKPGDASYNYQFIIDAFASPAERKDTLNESGTTLTYSIGNMELNKFRLRYNDISKGTDAIACWDHLLINPSAIQPEVNRYAVNRIQLDSAIIVYSDSANNKWGIRHFNLDAEDVKYSTDSILANVHTLTLQEKKGFAIKQFHGDVLYSNKEIALKNLLLQTNKSRLASEVVAKVPSWTTIKDSLSQMQINAVLENAHLDLTEVTQLLPDLKNNKSLRYLFRKIIDANGKITGNMQRLQVNELNLADNDGSKIFVTGVVQNATDYNHLLADVKEIDVQSGARSIKSWLPAGTIPDSIAIPVQIHILGSGTYSKNAILADLKLNTSDGDIIINGNAANYMDMVNSRYDVRVPLLRINAGKLLKDTTLGLINGSFSAKGIGYDYKRLTANINLLIKEAVYRRYHYKNIHTEAALSRGDFNVLLNSRDPNVLANLQLKGAIDNLKRNMSGYVNIDKLDLYATHWTSSPLATKGNILLDVPSMQPRHLRGDVLLTGFQLADDSTLYALDTVKILASDTSNQQQLSLSGPFGFLTANGDYDYTTAFTDLAAMVQRHFKPADERGVASAYSARSQIMDVNASLVWPKSLHHLMPSLEMNKPLLLTGHLNTDSSLLTANFILPSLRYNEFKLDSLSGNINAIADSLIANIYLASLAHPTFPLDKTIIDISASNGRLNTDINLLDKGGKQKYALGAWVQFLSNNGLLLSLKPDLLLNKQSWVVSDKNEVRIENGALRSADLTISSRGQSLGVKTISAGTTTTPDLEVNFSNFKLATITGFIKSDSLLVDGSMNGVITLQNLLQQPVFTSNLTINDLSFKQDTVGNVALQVRNSGNTYVTDASITGRGNDIALTGSFAPQGSTDISLNLDLAVRRLELKTLEGAAASFVKSASGAINGNVSVNGSTSQPRIQGTLNFDSAAISTTVLGGPLMINNEKLNVTENGFVFDNFTIRDSANNELNLNGTAATSNFINYKFGLDVNARNFRALNTTKKDNKIYYGQLYVTSNLHVGGTEQTPKVDGTVTVNDKTNFTVVIPQQEPGVVEREGVVVFTDFDAPKKDSLLLAYDSLNTANIFGFDISTNIEIQKEAVFNIIVDEANGDFLNVQGTGQLSTGIDPSGKITLTGSYVLDRGSYQFSLNFLKRKFDIQQGSKIVWLGEPTSAQVDVKAIYTTNAAPLDLVEDRLAELPTAERNIYLQKLPFQIHLDLSGELMKPIIAFDIILPPGNYAVGSDITTEVNARLAQIRQQPSELNKQVFAVLLMNRFVGENPFQSSGEGFSAGSFARQSVSRLMTEQLNQLAAGLIEGVELNFDVASSNDYTTGERRSRTDLNVGLSKRLLNDRLQVTVGSNFELEGPQQSNQRSNNIAGNVAVNYQLSKSGRYLLRFYRKNEYQGVVDGYIIETGLGFIMTVDYNRIREILHAKKIRREREARQAAREQRRAEREANNQNPQQQ